MAVSGYGGVVPILICFVPMMGIAIAYQRLNRWDQSSGATYTWVAKVFHPYLGFLSGWMILLYYTLGTTTLTIPAGVYTLDLVAPALVDDHRAIFLVGAGWNLLITALAVVGLKVVARFEWVIVVFQYTVLLIVAAVALAALLHGTAAVEFSWAWFSWTGLGGMKGLMGGILIACFMYSGWDASIYVNEETTDRANNPGKAALASVVMLALVYSIVTFAFQSVLSPGEIQDHAGDILSAVSGRLMHKPWDSVMALVVLAGTLATLQAAVVSAARVGLAMSRDRVMPAFFQRLSTGSGSPWANPKIPSTAANTRLLRLPRMAPVAAFPVSEKLSIGSVIRVVPTNSTRLPLNSPEEAESSTALHAIHMSVLLGSLPVNAACMVTLYLCSRSSAEIGTA